MDEQELTAHVTAASFEEDGRCKLTCPQAFQLAGEHGVELREIARVCNRNGIKICKCQLGCFK